MIVSLLFSITDEVERRLFNGLIQPCDRLECADSACIVYTGTLSPSTIERGRFDSLISFQHTHLRTFMRGVVFVLRVVLPSLENFGGFEEGHRWVGGLLLLRFWPPTDKISCRPAADHPWRWLSDDSHHLSDLLLMAYPICAAYTLGANLCFASVYLFLKHSAAITLYSSECISRFAWSSRVFLAMLAASNSISLGFIPTRVLSLG